MDRRSYGSPASMRSSGSSRSGLTEIEEEMAAVEEEKVYVALGKEVKEGKANLLWALENSSREKKIVIVHVYRPAQKIPMSKFLLLSPVTTPEIRNEGKISYLFCRSFLLLSPRFGFYFPFDLVVTENHVSLLDSVELN